MTGCCQSYTVKGGLEARYDSVSSSMNNNNNRMRQSLGYTSLIILFSSFPSEMHYLYKKCIRLMQLLQSTASGLNCAPNYISR